MKKRIIIFTALVCTFFAFQTISPKTIKTELTSKEQSELKKLNTEMCRHAEQGQEALLKGTYKKYKRILTNAKKQGMSEEDLRFELAKLFLKEDKPIHKATAKGDFSMVKLILDLGKGKSLATEEDILVTKGALLRNSLNTAALSPSTDVYKEFYDYLKKKYQDIVDKEIEGSELGEKEKKQAKEKIIDALFSKYINVRDEWGNNALATAVCKPWSGADANQVKYLLEKGASVTNKNNWGENPMGLAFRHLNFQSHGEMLKYNKDFFAGLLKKLQKGAANLVDKVTSEMAEDPLKFAKKVKTKIDKAAAEAKKLKLKAELKFTKDQEKKKALEEKIKKEKEKIKEIKEKAKKYKLKTVKEITGGTQLTQEKVDLWVTHNKPQFAKLEKFIEDNAKISELKKKSDFDLAELIKRTIGDITATNAKKGKKRSWATVNEILKQLPQEKKETDEETSDEDIEEEIEDEKDFLEEYKGLSKEEKKDVEDEGIIEEEEEEKIEKIIELKKEEKEGDKEPKGQAKPIKRGRRSRRR